MVEINENINAVIRQKDPAFPEHLDFVQLRKEGLRHIGQLSGKLWTDHNVHDPGITILEALCYALIDLGYRTTLPFQDLIAKADGDNAEDDNFLTPLQALTVNPVTIVDYRKLLLEIEGVRNAWLTVATKQEVALLVNVPDNKLVCLPNASGQVPVVDWNAVFSNEDLIGKYPCLFAYSNETPPLHFPKHLPVQLNGLYHVLLEKESWASDAVIVAEAKKLLSAHRNLCEDFIDIQILCPEPIGVCAEIELRPDAVAEAVYAEIIKKLRQFIQPEINYYSLQELLDKGRPMEEIFAGRPMLEESVGFVDTEELENLHRATKIHLSDIYHEILSVEGVRTIRNLHLIGGNPPKGGANDKWVETICIPNNFVFSFDLEKTCIDLRNGAGSISINREKIHKSIPQRKKALMPPGNLDKQPPLGNYRDDLGEFISIQNDFPVVYGIGPDGLSDDTTLQRQAQALQLKGYLLFFDQLLANYLAQLSHLRDLFSMKYEPERPPNNRHTYFSQNPAELPGIERLIRFYSQNESGVATSTQLAVPVKCNAAWEAKILELKNNSRAELEIANPCDTNRSALSVYEFSSVNLRQAYIGRLVDAFKDNRFSIEVLRDKFGCFFVMTVSALDDIKLVSTQRFGSATEAREQANQAAFVGSLAESYTMSSGETSTGSFGHFFEIAYKPLSNLRFLQDVLEDENRYLQRRTQFLKHLLARFSEQFTDFSLLQFAEKKSAKQLLTEQVDARSLFLSNYADISRNRGKALDYLGATWNTDNVSGFEKRVAMLAGFSNFQRRSLCNFEVQPCFKFTLNDERGAPVFHSSQSNPSREAMLEEARAVLAQLRDRSQYPSLERRLNGFNSAAAARLFARQASDENILVSKYFYRIELTDRENTLVRTSLNAKIDSQKAAEEVLPDFMANINKQKPGAGANRQLKLVKTGKDSTKWLDIAAVPAKISTHISWKWQVFEGKKQPVRSSDSIFLEASEAWADFVGKGHADPYILRHETAWRWRMNLSAIGLRLFGNAWYPEGGRAQAAWRQAKAFGKVPGNYLIQQLPDGKAALVLQNEKKAVLAVSEPFEHGKYKDAALVAAAVSAFEEKKARADFDKTAGKFGFHIDDGRENVLLTNYQAYDDAGTALQMMGKVFEAGKETGRYLLSGDEGNPEYNFLIKDEQDLFLASPPKTFDTEGDRKAGLTQTKKYFAANVAPVQVLEEPRQYSWVLLENNEVVLQSEKRLLSPAAAQTDYEAAAIKALGTKSGKLFEPHLYNAAIIAEPAAFKFIYNSSKDGSPQPLFVSTAAFDEKDRAVQAYAAFVGELPTLKPVLQKEKGQPDGLLLQSRGDKKALAALYRDESGKPADIEAAQQALQYAGTVYPENPSAQDAFIAQSMVLNGNGLFAWRFLKKNEAVGMNPQNFNSKEEAERLKAKICAFVPRFEPECCKTEPVVICSEVTKKYHYLVRFADTEGRTFELQGFHGYDTYAEALSAYQKEWYRLILSAQKSYKYNQDGPIRPKEDYAVSQDQCDGGPVIALIRDDFRKKWDPKWGSIDHIVDVFAELANLFPVISEIRVNEAGEPETCYRYAVLNTGYSTAGDPPVKTLVQELIWQSAECFDTPEQALEGYGEFLPLLGNQNGCRVFCSPTHFYVGVVEILAESDCEYLTEDEAWGEYAQALDAQGNPLGIKKDECGLCVNTGVREFIHAAENPRNCVPFKSGNFWRFKVVSPDYFVVKHNCAYNTQEERNTACDLWIENLKQLDCANCFPEISTVPGKKNARIKVVGNTGLEQYISSVEPFDNNEAQELWVCRVMQALLDCDDYCTKLSDCLTGIAVVDPGIQFADVLPIAKKYPIYKTDEGFCFRTYWPANDPTGTGPLQPCDCKDSNVKYAALFSCTEPYPFVSANCYPCLAGAKTAFNLFCEGLRKGQFSVQLDAENDYGPFSFTLIDPGKVIALHPQQYHCRPELDAAMARTKACLNTEGMQLIEHILLRPRNVEKDCDCLLPIDPDYCCGIDFLPDYDKDDPCAKPEDLTIHYLPGADPYSFWATLAMPDWNPRFRGSERRRFLEQLLYQEAPALVGLNILWLSPKQMCKLEDSWKLYLEYLNCPTERLLCSVEPPLCAIADCIKSLCSTDPCDPPANGESDCNCGSRSAPALDDCCALDDYNKSIFWAECPPVNRVDDPTNPNREQIPGIALLRTAAEPVRQGLESAPAAAGIEKPSKATAQKEVKAAPRKKAKAAAKPKTGEKTPSVEADDRTSEEKKIARIRQRPTQYQNAVAAIADKKLEKTESYKRAIDLLKNPPSVPGFKQFALFVAENSLQKKGGATELQYHTLLQNAAFFLFDFLVATQASGLTEAQTKTLSEALEAIKEKGFPSSSIAADWNTDDIKTKDNKKIINQLLKLL